MYGRNQDFCLRSIIVKLLTEYQKRKKGFGPDFVKWVSVLMADAKSCAAYCGWLSEYFAVEAGIRQGCPFSPLAFVLAVELLAIKNMTLREHKRVKLSESKKRPLGKYQ